MIFAINSEAQWIYASHEWVALTGQPTEDALGRGWLSRIHADDRSIVADIVEAATRAGSEYCVRYRLLRPDDTPRWVGAGAVPAFGMQDSNFIGYLGSITELAQGATEAMTAYGNVGRFVPPAPHPATMASDNLDRIADYLILAHSLIEEDGAKAALPSVKKALFEVGRALAGRIKDGRPRLN